MVRATDFDSVPGRGVPNPKSYQINAMLVGPAAISHHAIRRSGGHPHLPGRHHLVWGPLRPRPEKPARLLPGRPDGALVGDQPVDRFGGDQHPDDRGDARRWPSTGNLGFLQIVLGYLLARIVISFLFLPHYFRGEMFTAYELMRRRFGERIRKLTAVYIPSDAGAGGRRTGVRHLAGDLDRVSAPASRPPSCSSSCSPFFTRSKAA